VTLRRGPNNNKPPKTNPLLNKPKTKRQTKALIAGAADRNFERWRGALADAQYPSWRAQWDAATAELQVWWCCVFWCVAMLCLFWGGCGEGGGGALTIASLSPPH
jgi:hypothetical protein